MKSISDVGFAMTIFNWNGDRLDVDFSGDHDHQIAFTVLAVAAYPERKDLADGRSAEKFFEALSAYIYRAAKMAGHIEKLPRVFPKNRDVYGRLDKGAFRIFRFGQLNAALMSNHRTARASPIRMTHGPDLSRMKLSISVSGDPLPAQAPLSQAKFLQYHQPFFGTGSGHEEDARSLAKRWVRPLLRVSHLISPLYGHILELTDAEQDGFATLLQSNPVWARDIVRKSQDWGKFSPQLWREMGFKNSSEDRMIHLHL